MVVWHHEYLLSIPYTCTLPVTKNGDQQVRLLVFLPIANKVIVTISYAGRVTTLRLQSGALIFTESAFYARRPNRPPAFTVKQTPLLFRRARRSRGGADTPHNEPFQSGVLYQPRDRFVAVLTRNFLSFESLRPQGTKKGSHGGQGRASHRGEKRGGSAGIRRRVP